jgi:hypothetical protein
MADTETLTIAIPRPALQALYLHAGKKNTRQYLNGIHITVNDSKLWLQATDGHRGISIHMQHDAPLPAELSKIVPIDLIKEMLKTKIPMMICKLAATVFTAQTLMGETGMGYIVCEKYPDMFRVAPIVPLAELAPCPFMANPDYIVDAGKAIDLLCGQGTHGGTWPKLYQVPAAAGTTAKYNDSAAYWYSAHDVRANKYLVVGVVSAHMVLMPIRNISAVTYHEKMVAQQNH